MWRDLKRAEQRALVLRANAGLHEAVVAELRALLAMVATEPEADQAICFHGSWALVHEAERDFGRAIRHREIEIDKIEWLQRSVREGQDPAFVLPGYEVEDLRLRQRILVELRQAYGGSGGGG